MSGGAQKLTLLEKAKLYREQDPDKWTARQQERRQEHELLDEIKEVPSYLKEYEVRQMKKVDDVKYNSEVSHGNEGRTIVVNLKFTTNGVGYNYRQSPRRASTIVENSDNALSIYHNKKSDNVRSQLTVSVVCVNNLFNKWKEGENRSEKCCVNVALCPHDEKRVMKSRYRNITLEGFARWDHDFVFRGITVEDLNNKYIKICLSGHSTSGRVFIGQTVLAGRGALIRMDDLQPRQPTMSEVLPLEKAMSNPGTNVSATLDLFPEDWRGMSMLSTLIKIQAGALFSLYTNNANRSSAQEEDNDTKDSSSLGVKKSTLSHHSGISMVA